MGPASERASHPRDCQRDRRTTQREVAAVQIEFLKKGSVLQSFRETEGATRASNRRSLTRFVKSPAIGRRGPRAKHRDAHDSVQEGILLPRDRTVAINKEINGRGSLLATIVAASVLVSATVSMSEQVAVRHTEGLLHGFLTLRTLDGSLLAEGDLIQTARGARVTSRLVFHFKDGSLHDETATFSQRQQLRLVSDHVVQKGR